MMPFLRPRLRHGYCTVVEFSGRDLKCKKVIDAFNGFMDLPIIRS